MCMQQFGQIHTTTLTNHVTNHFREILAILQLDLVWQRARDTRSSWLNCALRDDEGVYWVSIRHYEAVAVGN